MLKLNSKLLGGAGVALLAATFAAPAQAQTTVLYSGGGTLAEKVYRDIFNCYGDTSGGELTAKLAGGAQGCNAVAAYNANRAVMYVGVGSGNGLKAFQTHDSTQFTLPTGGSARTPDSPPVNGTTAYGQFYGAGVGINWVANANGTAYPKVSYVGSDDPLTQSNINTYTANSNNWGKPIQFPALVTSIAVAFSPLSVGWLENGKDLKTTGASSRVQFKTNTLCGIFTGAINDWSNAEIKADNGNKVLGTGPINVVYRGDGSGSTFLFSNALIHQCGSQTNPRAGITHPVPDAWLSDNAIANTAGLGADNIGNSNNNFFLAIQAANRPANFNPASGSGGVKTAIAATPGSVGYLSPDFTKNGKWVSPNVIPFDSTGPKAANLQTYYSFLHANDPVPVLPKYVAAVPAAGALIMASSKAPTFTPASGVGSCDAANSNGIAPRIQSTDGICAHNPLNWGVINPLPLATGAYPVGGFTFIDMYTCYASTAERDALVGKVTAPVGLLGLWRWYFGSATENGGHPKTELMANGFSVVPSGWVTAAKKLLLTDLKTAVGVPGQAKTGCSTLPASGGA